MSEPASRTEAYTATMGLRGERVIIPNIHDLVDRLAGDLMDLSREALSRRGEFHLALSGGKTPEKLLRTLVIDPRYRLLPWHKTHVWLVDERCVDQEDERYNWGMIRDLLLDHVPIPRSQAHRMPTEEKHGDSKYEAQLQAALGDEARLDVVILGMGGDGHTASLFPHTPALKVTDRWITLNDGERVIEPRPRMTMTYPLINDARYIAPLVTGTGKHAMLQTIISDLENVEEYPILGVKPNGEHSKMVWYMDDAAALGVEHSDE